MDSSFDDLELLPHWVYAKADGVFQRNAALPTKDGRKIGNAFLARFEPGHQEDDEYALVVSDAGNITRMTNRELETHFHPPIFLMKHPLPIHTWALELHDAEKET